MPGYPYDQYHRVVLAPTVADLWAPTVAEILAGVDITCDLTKDGLPLSKSTESIARGRWRQALAATDAGHYSYDSLVLKGRRYPWPQPEPFFSAAVYHSRQVLIVRRGILYETGWVAGQPAECLAVQLGMRSTAPSAANAQVTFTLPLFVADDTDSAVVA